MKRYLITLFLLIITAVANYGYSKPEGKQERHPLENFPNTIGNWESVENHLIDDKSMAVLLVDDYIMRTYRSSEGEVVSLYVGYFETQREGKQVHSPRQCLPGAGWTTIKHEEIELPSVYNQEKAYINYQIMAKGDQQQLYLWWYQGRGRIYANEYLNKAYLIWDALTKQRTDGALVRINTPLPPDKEGQQLNGRVSAFLAEFMPIINEFIPN